ncbi:mechanosensitive ion channel family protein [Brevundimonas lutea]|uniref:mechanosensitive ion channel family protein n=1 Tax=Brevundimonas lutea TaxID=2293980 RepID=UPI000F0235FC|nr:mechanosensitive ion channel domain-containing protein [Brevundimonas lutea]
MSPDLTALDQIDDTALLRVAGATITVGGLVSAAVILGIAIVLSWAVTRGLRRARDRSNRSAGALYLLEKLAGYGIVIAGVMMALSATGLNLSSLAIFAGAIGIGIGLGLQGVVKEFVSGIFLIFDRMVSVGDYVELEDAGVKGAIMEIGPRATRIRTNDNVNVLVPNSHLIEGPVTNWTLKGDTRRIHIPFGVAYGADRGKVRDAVLAAARASPFTLPETDARKCQVWLVKFGDSALEFELLVWPTKEAVKRPGAMHAAYTWLIADALDAAGVEVPFPQTDLHVRSLFGREGDDALKVLGHGERLTPAPAAPQTPPQPSGANDAADDLLAPPPSPDPEPDRQREADRASDRRP